MDKKTKELLEDFHRGTCIRAYELLGCHRTVRRGKAGYVFRVWAPNAKSICVVGEFNFWNQEDLPMERLERGVWEVFTTRGYEGCPYKNGRKSGTCKCRTYPDRACKASGIRSSGLSPKRLGDRSYPGISSGI